jgi:antitoxin component of MazEF toxin-antitoxin module
MRLLFVSYISYIQISVVDRTYGICTVDIIWALIHHSSMTLESTVSVAKAGTNSLRATLPQGIVSYLNLKARDKLEWSMNRNNNDRIVMVSKKRVDQRKSLDFGSNIYPHDSNNG